MGRRSVYVAVLGRMSALGLLAGLCLFDLSGVFVKLLLGLCVCSGLVWF